MVRHGLADYTGSAADSHVMSAATITTRNIELTSVRSNPKLGSEKNLDENQELARVLSEQGFLSTGAGILSNVEVTVSKRSGSEV